MSVAEGGNAATARSLLNTMRKAGLVKRLKLEPFDLNRVDHGVDATPDILFQFHDGRVFVVEVKASKYLTDEKLSKLRHVEAAVKSAGMTYLLWTDVWPLSSVVWRQIRELRRLGSSDVPYDRILEVAERVIDSPKTMHDLRKMGFYRQFVLAAVWEGRAHVDLFSPITDSTIVSSNPAYRRFEALLSAPVGGHSWFTSLTEAFVSQED